ncbi:unnamed protein product [Nezara viridula]|uniref:Uncharacterized protein n=1 Tax=Nezara viridula TaxID=85310 RepID=A0A9P0HCV4_NEZVI|nr:unnamed protein product [Nezara viridula]
MAQLNSFLPEPIDENEEAERLYFLERRCNLLKRSGIIEKLHTVFNGKPNNSKYPIKIYTKKREVQNRDLTATEDNLKNDTTDRGQIILRRSSRLRRKDVESNGNNENDTKPPQKSIHTIQEIRKINSKTTGKSK